MVKPTTRGYRIMVEGNDASGEFFVTYDVSGDTVEDAVSRLESAALAEGWRVVEIEESEMLLVHGPQIVQVSGRAYFGAS